MWPCTQHASFTITALAGGGSQGIEVVETPFVAHLDWLLGAFNVLSFAVKKDQLSGAIRLDVDPGNGLFYQAFMFPLSGEGVIDTLTGFDIGGLAARFTFINGMGAATDASGWLQLRSW